MTRHRFSRTALHAAILTGLLFGTTLPALAAPASSPESMGKYMNSYPPKLLEVQPPWSAPLYPGTEVTVPGMENVPDIHGDINNPELVVFFAGNQYMLVNRLMEAFSKAYPQYPRVVAFTLPPGRLITAIKRGNGILLGNMHITLQPDVLTAGHGSIMRLQTNDHWFTQTEIYAKNRLAIMTQKGNPDHITGLKDLAQPNIKLCMPNPAWEGIAKSSIIPALKKTGGEALVDEVYKNKVAAGTTFLTHVHHRETPIRIMENQCNAGVVWYTEAYFHAKIAHHPTDIVEIPAADNQEVSYTAGQMKNAPHPEAAKAFMTFLLSPEAQALYHQFGFMPPK
ncbi:MAG: substrate-binding domain-containing protein [Halothiobacillus sp.]|jgi:molybdate transport system substrate-binding protein|uniref:substrate-binding domain-containing protein n=1 Tax=Halothiobacillus sp. TaxID=1891311 RepID=UPI002AD2049B|nr:substrate-binding domain-containing protein [Halothiobacillus sp.]MDA3877323.1 substrate-binding domain-containing protein [Halothiobacillus sp.]